MFCEKNVPFVIIRRVFCIIFCKSFKIHLHFLHLCGIMAYELIQEVNNNA